MLRQQVLERLVLQEIQMQRADHAGVKVSDETRERGAAGRRQAQQHDAAAAARGARQAGHRLRQLPRGDPPRDHAAACCASATCCSASASPRARSTSSWSKQAKTPSEHNEYNVSHILIAVGQEASPAQLEAAAKRATDVYERAKGGEDFAKLAVAYSNSQTALDGGALGWRKGSELPTFLADVIAKLKPGEVSEPLRTPTGFHIVRLNEVRGAHAAGASRSRCTCATS